MAIAVRSTAVVSDFGGTGSEPAGATSGDLIVMIKYDPFDSTAITPPTGGWTEVIDDTITTGGGGRVWAGWVIRTGSAPSYAFGGSSAGIFTLAITGHDAVTPMDATPPAVNKQSGVANPVSPSITTVTANTLLICGTGNDASTQAITQPTSFTTIDCANGCEVAYIANAATGATGTKQWTSASQEWGSITLAVRPAGGAATASLPPIYVPTRSTRALLRR